MPHPFDSSEARNSYAARFMERHVKLGVLPYIDLMLRRTLNDSLCRAYAQNKCHLRSVGGNFDGSEI